MLEAQMLKLIVVLAVLALATAFRPTVQTGHGSWTRRGTAAQMQMSSQQGQGPNFEKSVMAAMLGLGLTLAPIDMVSAAVVAPSVVAPATTATTAVNGKKTTVAPATTAPAKTVEEVAIEAATIKKKEGKVKVAQLEKDVKAGKAKELQLKGDVKKEKSQIDEIKKKLTSGKMDSKTLAIWEGKRADVQKNQMDVSLVSVSVPISVCILFHVS
jgi:competence protein ComGC